MTKVEKTLYFETTGIENTEETLKAAKERAEALGIKDIIVASTTGRVGIRACEMFKGFNLIIVRHQVGLKEPGLQEMSSENEAKIASSAKLLTSTHVFGGIERAIRNMLGTWGPVELMGRALKLFGDGAKVCIEITVMAADAGLIGLDRDVIAIAGSSKGADTALVIKPANSTNFFDLYVKEIIAKPLIAKTS
jgi:hypothetical protein